MPTKSRGANGDPYGGGTLQSQVAGGVATVTFGHPKGNSLPGPLLRELARKISEAGEASDVRVIVLRSRGTGAFCGGASFDELVSIQSRETGKAFFSGFAQVILAMVRAPKLVVTRVQGKVVGGGVGIVAASDLVCAVRTAAARLSELAVGIGPFVVAPCIERKMGAGAFSAMTVDTEWRDADWCERHGLFSRLYPDPEALDTGVREIAERLAASNPEAMARLKSVFWAGTGDWEALMEDRAEISGELVLSDFTRAAIEGFRSR